MLIKRGVLLAASGLVTLLSTRDVRDAQVSHRAGAVVSRAPLRYDVLQKEWYLTEEQISYIRPGLNITIVGVTNVAPKQSPIVELLMADDLGQPLDRNGQVTPGKIEAEFILGRWDASNHEYVNLTTVAFSPTTTFPLHDVGGTWTDLGLGHAKYTFAKVLPADFDVAQTVTLGIYAARSTKDIIGKDYMAPAAFKDFRPDGGTVTPVFAAIDTASCNKCHPLSMHEQFGPRVQDVKLCVLCHTSQMLTSHGGQSLEFKALIHRIHDAVGAHESCHGSRGSPARN